MPAFYNVGLFYLDLVQQHRGIQQQLGRITEQRLVVAQLVAAALAECWRRAIKLVENEFLQNTCD